MPVQEIIRGDSYIPFSTIALLDGDEEPLDLSGCTVFVTYKPVPTDPNDDNTDSTAPIRQFIKVDAWGSVESSFGLSLQSTAAEGLVIMNLTAAETTGFPLGIPLRGDVQVLNSVLSPIRVKTFFFDTELVAIDGYTNRLGQTV